MDNGALLCLPPFFYVNSDSFSFLFLRILIIVFLMLRRAPFLQADCSELHEVRVSLSLLLVLF